MLLIEPAATSFTYFVFYNKMPTLDAFIIKQKLNIESIAKKYYSIIIIMVIIDRHLCCSCMT